LCEELGDLLLQVVFHAAIAKEKSEFEYSDIVDGVCRKLVVRHPHVFGDDYVGSAGEMVGKWEQIKVQTKHRDTPYADMNSVAKTLPSAVRAQKIAKRAEKYGLPIPKAREMNEEALGEAMFSLCAMAQGAGIDAEEALCRYTNQIILRSKELEQ
jgi:tetrapyrrole methylase family protein/MazG family protein